MGFDFGLSDENTIFKKKHRWLFKIDDVSADQRSISCLPPTKAMRPNLTFREIEVQHLNEIIYLPGKPEWKTITLTLYDLHRNLTSNPVFDWLLKMYNPESGNFYTFNKFKKSKAYLELYGGCGELLEEWAFESIWPQDIQFGDLDMDSSDVVTCDLTLRYDRAYLRYGANNTSINDFNTTNNQNIA